MPDSTKPDPLPGHQDKPDDKRVLQVCPRWRDLETGFINFLADMGLPAQGDPLRLKGPR